MLSVDIVIFQHTHHHFLQILAEEYPGGLVSDQIAQLYGGCRLNVDAAKLSIRPRLTELEQQGKIEKIGERKSPHPPFKTQKIWRIKKDDLS